MPTELAESTGRQFVFHRCGLVLCAFILGCGSGFTVVFEDSTRFSGRELHLDGTAYAWWRTFDAQALDRKLDPGILELRFYGATFASDREWRRAPGRERLALLSDLRSSDALSVSVLHVEGDHTRSGQWNRDSDGRQCAVPCVLEQCQEAFQCAGQMDLRVGVVLPIPDRDEPIDTSQDAPEVAMLQRSFGTDWNLSLDQADQDDGGRVAGVLTLTADEDNQEELGIRFNLPLRNARLAGCNERSQFGSQPSIFPCEGLAP